MIGARCDKGQQHRHVFMRLRRKSGDPSLGAASAGKSIQMQRRRWRFNSARGPMGSSRNRGNRPPTRSSHLDNQRLDPHRIRNSGRFVLRAVLSAANCVAGRRHFPSSHARACGSVIVSIGVNVLEATYHSGGISALSLLAGLYPKYGMPVDVSIKVAARPGMIGRDSAVQTIAGPRSEAPRYRY